MKRLRMIGAALAVSAIHVPETRAQDLLALCGPAPALSGTLQTDENIKGQLQGQADLLSKLVGKTELSGQVDAARKQLYQSSDKYFAAQKEAYLAYMFCLLTMQDKTSGPLEKMKALQAWRNPLATPAPPAAAAPAVPVTMNLVPSEVRPLDGYRFVNTPELPSSLRAGPLLPGGGTMRLVFQTTDPDRIVQVDRVSVTIAHRDIPGSPSFRYAVDPTKMPGFGTARPHRFNVSLSRKGPTQAFYVNAANVPNQIQTENVLSGTDMPLLLLDRSAGLQETLDFVLMAAEPGLYEIQFTAHASSQGQEYDLQSGPIYIVRN